jgi:hypothetical protein
MNYEIPFTLFRLDENSCHPLIESVIHGKRCFLIIDTGASRSVFDINSFMVEFHEPAGDKKLIPAGIIEGVIENKIGILTEFSLGDFTATNLEAVFINLDHINRLYSQIDNSPEISGLLGADFLDKYQAVMDFKKQILKLCT